MPRIIIIDDEITLRACAHGVFYTRRRRGSTLFIQDSIATSSARAQFHTRRKRAFSERVICTYKIYMQCVQCLNNSTMASVRTTRLTLSLLVI